MPPCAPGDDAPRGADTATTPDTAGSRGPDPLRRRLTLSLLVAAAGVPLGGPRFARASATGPWSQDDEENLYPDDGAIPEDPRALTTGTIRESEKVIRIAFTDTERRMMLEHGLGAQIERLAAVDRFGIVRDDAPASVFVPWTSAPRAVRPGCTFDPGEIPGIPEARGSVLHAPILHLSHWLRTGAISSEELTELSLDRLQRADPFLRCTITMTAQTAIAQARRADQDLAAGRWRGPLHGIPWGAKDLLDTAGIPTTWGAEPFLHRVPADSAEVVHRLEAAGAVLVAKLSLGALAYGDLWYGGRTMNPFDLSQGSSGSSAGSAAAVAAGLVGFALGTETYGSIVSPSLRCGTVGLRPTFGRVSRAGAMPLCWSLDKIGPITRRVQDALLVLAAIDGEDPRDPSTRAMTLGFDAFDGVAGMRVGWLNDAGTGPPELEHPLAGALHDAGAMLERITLPDWPWESLVTILLAESAAAFDDLTRLDLDDQLAWQEPAAWPNTFRMARLLPAVDLVQADRFRRRVMHWFDTLLAPFDAIAAPGGGGPLLLITNMTGHPSLTVRTGFRGNGTPTGATLFGHLADEGTLINLGLAAERALADVVEQTPTLPGLPDA